ncbi:hypothetical protein ACETK8_19660 [Brevundimonas staleyi]|uniref:Uncharacterized protein n=1 Tax=Brevundimonas staleyi TaxID=74326 RepID=A0ABW0FRY0_9CAUL
MRFASFDTSALEAKSRQQLLRETFFFLASFVATLGGSMILMNHAAAVIA